MTPIAAASPPITQPTQANGSGVAQAVKGQTPAPVAAAKTPSPQGTKLVIREQQRAIFQDRATNAAAIAPAVKPTQVNQSGVSPTPQEQTVIPDAAAEQLDALLAENVPEEPQPAVKVEVEAANAAAPPIPSTDASATQAMVMIHEKPTNAAAPTSTPQSSQPPTRPLTRRGSAGRTMPEKRASTMPQAGKQPSPAAAAIPVLPTAIVSRPNHIVQQTGQTQPKATAVAEAIYGADEQPLRYRNGVLVDRTNAAEVEAFQLYETEKQSVPLSRPQLRTYMRQKLVV